MANILTGEAPLRTALAALLLPRRCPLCGVPLTGGEENRLCRRCNNRVVPVGPVICRSCGLPLNPGRETGRLCGECLRRPPPLQAARSLYLYSGAVRELVHELKFRRHLEVLPAVRELVAAGSLPVEFARCELVIPVPLHKKRLQKRGCNQSLLLAQAFFRDDSSKIVVKLLERRKNTTPQTRLDRSRRAGNLHNAFHVTAPELLYGRRICLVDDVYTTGATIRECAEVLVKSAGCEVYALTFARTPSFDERLS